MEALDEDIRSGSITDIHLQMNKLKCSMRRPSDCLNETDSSTEFPRFLNLEKLPFEITGSTLFLNVCASVISE